MHARLLTLFILPIVLAAVLGASQAVALEIENPYMDGTAACALEAGLVDKSEHGIFVEVPVDYLHPNAEKMRIYAWTYGKPFDPAKNSVVYFVGGPGGNAHGITRITDIAPDFNVIHFDQRGISCSRPTDKNLLLRAGFFSSEATARDADRIRQHLKVEKWTVYGHSYGTVPATIYAHHFAASTRAAVLEGVIFDGQERLWLAPHRMKILRRYFERLPSNLQLTVLEESQRLDVPKHWFSAMAQDAMQRNFPLQILTQDLQRLFALDPDTRARQLREIADYSWMNEDSGTGFAGYAFNQLGCRELSGGNEASNWFAVFEGGQLVPAKLEFMQTNCKKLGTDPNTYASIHYPLTVPVTYFQGGLDGATEAPSAIFHYKRVAKGPAQILIAPQGGHSAIQYAARDPDFIRDVVREALLGRRISSDALKKSNASDEYKVVITNKGF